MKFHVVHCALASACLLLIQPVQAQTAAPTQAPAASSSMASGVTGKPTLNKADVTFMKAAAESGHLEVEGSTLAGQKASSEAAKAFAKQMVEDHTKAGDELKRLAASKNVALPEKPSLVHRGKLKLLGASSGASFDKKYAAGIGVTAHADTVRLFEKAAAGTKDADVKAFAVKTLPALKHHLEMAKQLQATVEGAQKTTSGS